MDLFYLNRLPVAVALVVGLIVLARHRRRSPRAATLALAGLGVYGSWWLAWHIAEVTNVWASVPAARQDVVIWITISVREVCLAACLLLLAFAVLADRRRGPPTGPEADYADAAEPGASARPKCDPPAGE